MRIYCLSIRQPYAEAILRGLKTEEYRTWPTRQRGLIAIHASKTIQGEALEHFPQLTRETLTTGALLGVVEVVECEPDGCGGFVWSLANPRRLRHPAPMPGRTGLFLAELDERDLEVASETATRTQ